MVSRIVQPCRFTSAAQMPLRSRNHVRRGKAIDSPFSGQEVGEESSMTNGEGLQLLTRSWSVLEGKSVKGAVFLVHGFSWHSGYFKNLAEALCQAGYTVTTFDLQGHGRSESALGIRGYVKTFENYVDDIELLVTAVHNQNKGLPVFAYGESFGSLLLLLFSLRDGANNMLSGMIVSSSVTEVAASVLPPKPLLVVLRFLARFFPRLPLPTAELKDTHLEAFGDTEVGLASLEDPLVLFNPPTLGFVDEVISATTHLSAKLKEIVLPLLVLHGQMDTRTSPNNSEHLFGAVSSKDKNIKRYLQGRHQLLQDQQSITHEVTADILLWLDERSAVP